MLFGRTTANRVSRFVDEIPEEDIKKSVPRGCGYREPSREQRAYGYAAQRSTQPQRPAAIRPPAQPKPGAAKQSAPAAAFEVGDRVRHKAFGPGRIVKKMPMGGDFLIEIDFDQLGPKKLMLRAAAINMTKL